MSRKEEKRRDEDAKLHFRSDVSDGGVFDIDVCVPKKVGKRQRLRDT